MSRKNENIFTNNCQGSSRDGKFQPGSNAVDITSNKDGGVLKEVVYEGWGEAKPRQWTVATGYSQAWLESGELIDMNHSVYQPFQVLIGSDITPMNICLCTMKEGERARFFIRDSPIQRSFIVHPSCTIVIVLEIELTGWESQDLSYFKDKCLLKDVIKDGTSNATPGHFANVEVEVVGRIYLSESPPFYKNSSLSFFLGDCDEDLIPANVQNTLANFRKGEKSRLLAKWLYGLKPEYMVKYKLRRTDILEYTITLKKFSRLKDHWCCGNKEKIKYANMIKDFGTKHFSKGDLTFALRSYWKAIDYLAMPFNSMSEDEERKSLLLKVHLNSSLCLLKLNNFQMAIFECEKALKLDPNNVKAFYRRGQGFLYLKEYDKAKESFRIAFALDPKNKAASNGLQRCEKEMSQVDDFTRRIFTNIFN